MLLIALPRRQTATFRSEGLEQPRQVQTSHTALDVLLSQLVTFFFFGMPVAGGGWRAHMRVDRVEPVLLLELWDDREPVYDYLHWLCSISFESGHENTHCRMSLGGVESECSF